MRSTETGCVAVAIGSHRGQWNERGTEPVTHKLQCSGQRTSYIYMDKTMEKANFVLNGWEFSQRSRYVYILLALTSSLRGGAGC